jgi:hypothetical protein
VIYGARISEEEQEITEVLYSLIAEKKWVICSKHIHLHIPFPLFNTP